jgi:hypothetical protein
MESTMVVAQSFVAFAVIISGLQIGLHLFHYNEPRLQLYICRILFMVPLYSVQSLLSLQYPSNALFLNSVRDCYEAYVLYYFVKLLVEFLGGQSSILCNFVSKRALPHPWPLNLCCANIKLDQDFYRCIMQGIMQFAILKPVTAAAALVMQSLGAYHEGEFSWSSGYSYIALVNNVSVTVALYCLLLFYNACEEELQPFRPFAKFVCIKSVIFFSFWQSCLFAVLIRLGYFGELQEATEYTGRVQDFCICVEMAGAAVAFSQSFSHREFVMTERKSPNILKPIGEVLNIKDVFDEAQSFFVSSKDPEDQVLNWE